jgi:1-aminocyclopropane-1-carboxylate deaminase
MEVSPLPLASKIVSANELIPLKHRNVSLYLKREDLIHPHVPGNKWRKLKYNLLEAQKRGCQTLLTFGGAFSNHIAAVAAAGQLYKFSTIGIIRGEELSDKISENPTLQFASDNGMKFHFISRQQYNHKESADFLEELSKEFGNFYLIPEGGTNSLAIKGCEEILEEGDLAFNYICSAVGTGGTLTGLLNSAGTNQVVLGFPALKGEFAEDEFTKFAKEGKSANLITDYNFGGYGKTTPNLIEFINSFYRSYNIKLDPIYTGKMFFGILDLIEQDYFNRGASILAIHTGGIQGVDGMNAQLKKKQQSIINFYD